MEILTPELFNADEGHNCKLELPYGDRALQPNKEQLPWGVVARCSCGRIWETQRYGWSYTEWVPAGWWNRWKYGRSRHGSKKA